jgi:hypothetical protein
MWLCYKQDDGRIACFLVLTKYVEHWWDRPSPEKPIPQPWIMDELLDEAVLKDLTILATAHQLAAELSPARQKTMETAIKAEIQKMPLPAGVTIRYATTPAK